MLEGAMAALALAAVLGAYLAVQFLQGAEPALSTGLIHGGVAAVGLVLLLVVVLTGPSNGYYLAAGVLFVIVALGGAFLFFYHLRGRDLPGLVILIHGAGAVVAFLLLLYGYFL